MNTLERQRHAQKAMNTATSNFIDYITYSVGFKSYYEDNHKLPSWVPKWIPARHKKILNRCWVSAKRHAKDHG